MGPSGDTSAHAEGNHGVRLRDHVTHLDRPVLRGALAMRARNDLVVHRPERHFAHTDVCL